MVSLKSVIDTDRPVNPATAPLSLRIISHNIRYATDKPFPNERPWPHRAPPLLNQLDHETRFTTASQSTLGMTEHNAGAFICLQEVLHTQLVDIMAHLNGIDADTADAPAQGPHWSYVGVGRDDGVTAGEYSPIIYPSSIFTVLESRTVWLSETPSKPGRGWDAASIRILNLCVFEHKATHRLVLAANTHLDDQGGISRVESVKLILRVLARWHKEWSQHAKQDMGVLLAGDFNSKPDDAAYELMKDSKVMVDAYSAIEPSRRYGHEVTFTGFEPEKGAGDIGRIDFVWLRSGHSEQQDFINQSWAVAGYAVLPNVFDNGVYLSDHRAVVVDLFAA